MQVFLVSIIMPALILGLAVVVLLMIERCRSAGWERWKREHPELVFGSPEYLERFRNPDFAAFEEVLGMPLPDSFKELHLSNKIPCAKEIVLVPESAVDFDDTWTICALYPADQEFLSHEWDQNDIDARRIPFAYDGFGGIYYMPLDETSNGDCPVYHYHYDGDVRIRVADSLNQFLSWRHATAEEIENGSLAN